MPVVWIEWLKPGFMRTVSAVNRPFFFLILYRQKSPTIYVSDWLKVACGTWFSSLVSCTVNNKPDKYRLFTFSPRPRTQEKAKKSCTSWFFYLCAVFWFTCNSSGLWQTGLVSSLFLSHSLLLVLKYYHNIIKPNYFHGIKKFRIILLTEVRNQSDFWMLKVLHELSTERFCSYMMQ